MSYLLGIKVGPVQAYIEESRKLRDLYNSSRIISRIMENIYHYIKDKSSSAELIYPNYTEMSEENDYSNYMVFQIENEISIKDIETQIYMKFAENESNELIKIFKENFNLFWAMVKFDDSEYDEAYKELTNLISSIKNTYEFEQVYQESGKKCSICGKRNIIKNKNKSKLNENEEELCEVCLFKREYKDNLNKKYDSVYTVATSVWEKSNRHMLGEVDAYLEKIFNEKAKYYDKNEINSLIKKFKGLKIYADKLEDNNCTVPNIIKLLEQNRGRTTLKKVKEINQELKKEFRETVRLDKIINKLEILEEKIENLYKEIDSSNYEYCFIQFDIDNLGRWINGEYLENKKELKEYQKYISNILVKFGKELRVSLADKCSIIYSGGDDFLGILPNENIIRVMEIIDEKFEYIVGKDLIKCKYDIKRKMTYSTSITIAQCKDPMNYSIRKSREELEQVKERFKDNEIPKNGVALNYIINNGKEITCYLKKDKFKTFMDIVKKYKQLRSEISWSYINAFENEFMTFKYDGISFNQLVDFINMTKYELKRLMERSKNIEISDKLEKETVEKLINKYIQEVISFVTEVIKDSYKEEKANKEFVDFKNIINTMKLNEKFFMINYVLEDGGI